MLHEEGENVICSKCAICNANQEDHDLEMLGRLKREALSVLRDHNKDAYKTVKNRRMQIIQYSKWLYNHLIDEEIYDGRLEDEFELIKMNYDGFLLGILKAYIMADVHHEIKNYGTV